MILELRAGPQPPLTVPEALACVTSTHARTAILVEGWSDEAALDAVAGTCGLPLISAATSHTPAPPASRSGSPPPAA